MTVSKTHGTGKQVRVLQQDPDGGSEVRQGIDPQVVPVRRVALRER